MRKRFVISLLGLGAVVAFSAASPPAAQAGCPTVGGYPVCSSWYTGSEICQNVIKAISKDIKDCDNSAGTCPAFSCTAYGTVGYSGCNDPAQPGDPNCSIDGVAICQNPQDKYNFNGTSYNLPGSLTAVAGETVCDTKYKGKCINFAELNPTCSESEPNCGICNNNWTFVTFTAREFKGEICVCPGGYDKSATQCCATSSRDGDTCGAGNYFFGDLGEGTPDCIQDFCKVDLSKYDFVSNKTIQYVCKAINY